MGDRASGHYYIVHIRNIRMRQFLGCNNIS